MKDEGGMTKSNLRAHNGWHCQLAFCFKSADSCVTSTLVEIQDAVGRLPGEERKALQCWLNSQAGPELSAQEEQRLLRSLEAAMRDIDAGKGVSIDEARQRVGSWAAK